MIDIEKENVFSCAICQRYFVLPSCCDHYHADKIQSLEAKVKYLESFKKEALELISFYGDKKHHDPFGALEIMGDNGKRARDFLVKSEVKKIMDNKGEK